MSKKRAALIVFINVDESPGPLDTEELAEKFIQNLLDVKIPEYNPRVYSAELLHKCSEGNN